MENVKKKEAILQYLDALKNLKNLKIIKNQKDFTSQLGEWLIAELLNGEIAINGKQEHWDIKVDDKKYQVKTHAKSITTPRSDSDIKYKENAKIDFLVIVVFSENYKLIDIYIAPWEVAFKLIKNNKNPVIKWSDLNDYKLNLKEQFKNNPLLNTFLEIK